MHSSIKTVFGYVWLFIAKTIASTTGTALSPAIDNAT
jgi:hypothetical protein